MEFKIQFIHLQLNLSNRNNLRLIMLCNIHVCTLHTNMVG